MNHVREFHIDGHKIAALAYNEDKPGIPIIFLHGIASSIYWWTIGQVPLVTEKCRWYSLSLPGHYPGVFPENFRRESLNSTMIADVLTQAIKQLVGDQPVILVGHSTGGFAALAIAATNPDLVKGVITVGGFVHGKWMGVLRLYQWLARRGAMGERVFRISGRITISSRAMYRFGIRFYAHDTKAMYAIPGFETLIDAMFPFSRLLDLKAMIDYSYTMPDIDIRACLPQIIAPTLVITGDLDPIVPPSQSRIIAERVSGAELKIISGAGHLPMLERHHAYQQIVTEWLSPFLK